MLMRLIWLMAAGKQALCEWGRAELLRPGGDETTLSATMPTVGFGSTTCPLCRKSYPVKSYPVDMASTSQNAVEQHQRNLLS